MEHTVHQVRFNVKNLKYAMPNSMGKWSAPVPYDAAKKVSLSTELGETPIIGDGMQLFSIVSEHNPTGSFLAVNINDDYEIACKRKMLIAGGLADVKQAEEVRHAIYFEVNSASAKGKNAPLKCWLLNVASKRPAESYDGSSVDPTVSEFETAFTVYGDVLRENDGETVHIGKDNEPVMIYKIVAREGDEGYATFGDTVPTPKMILGA